MFSLRRGRATLMVASVSLVILGASPAPSPTIQCDVGDVATCNAYVQLALVLASEQGQMVASAELVSAQQPTAIEGAASQVQYVQYFRSGADLGLVVLRDSAGSVTSLVLIGTIGISIVPNAWAADPSTYPAWYAKFGYPSWYSGPRATLPPTEISRHTIALWAVVLVAAAVLIHVAVTSLRSWRLAAKPSH